MKHVISLCGAGNPGKSQESREEPCQSLTETSEVLGVPLIPLQGGCIPERGIKMVHAGMRLDVGWGQDPRDEEEVLVLP